MHRTWTNNDKFKYANSIHKYSNTKTKSFLISEKYLNPCPIKSSKSIIPKDLNLESIFTTMLKSSYDLNIMYSNLTSTVNIDIFSRKRIFRRIREYFISNLIEYKIYFKTILLFDIISIENERIKLLNNFEEIALGALMLSIKFNYDENKMFSMKKFLKFYGEQNYTLNDIIEIERKTLKIVHYFLNYTTPMCFLEFFILNGIIYNVDNLSQNDYHKIYAKTENVLEKIMEESNNYLKYNFFYLACSVVSYCRHIFHLEKWPFMLKRVFSIDFSNFQNIYNIFFSFREREKEIKTYNNNMKNGYNCTTYNCHLNKDIIINGNNNVVLLDLKSLDNSSANNTTNDTNNNTTNNEKENKYKNNTFNMYKKNTFKTINHYNNNIINININNVSLNNIYNTKTNKNLSSNRFQYNLSNNTINNYNNKNEIQRSFKIYDGIYKKSISKNKYKNRYKNKNDTNFKSIKNLAEIKEVKDYVDLKPYVSPQKRKRKHYYANRIEENEKDDKNENNKNDSSNITEDKNEENNKTNNYRTKNYTYNKNSLNNINNVKEEKILMNYDKNNKFYVSKNDFNKNKNNEIKDQNNNENHNTIDNSDNNRIKYNNNINIRSYAKNKIYLYEENDKNDSHLGEKNFISEKSDNKSTNYKCDSSRFIQTTNNKHAVKGVFYTDNKEQKITKNNENDVKRNLVYKNVDYNEKNRNKKIKIDNKIKYNDLIKYKLAMSNSMNKRK